MSCPFQPIDIDGNKVYLELSKDGAVWWTARSSPHPADNAGMKDKTYYYKKDIGDSKDVVNVRCSLQERLPRRRPEPATVDGLWQLSGRPQGCL